MNFQRSETHTEPWKQDFSVKHQWAQWYRWNIWVSFLWASKAPNHTLHGARVRVWTDWRINIWPGAPQGGRDELTRGSVRGLLSQRDPRELHNTFSAAAIMANQAKLYLFSCETKPPHFLLTSSVNTSNMWTTYLWATFEMKVFVRRVRVSGALMLSLHLAPLQTVRHLLFWITFWAIAFHVFRSPLCFIKFISGGESRRGALFNLLCPHRVLDGPDYMSLAASRSLANSSNKLGGEAFLWADSG